MAEKDGRGEGFLSRWSRRKQAAREGAPAAGTPAEEAAAPEALAEAPLPVAHPPEPETETEIDLASLPRIEDLTIASDVTAFLRKGVPAVLRNAALRRMWSLDPAIRDFIGPADYAWDWNTPGGAPGYMADIASGPDVEALADRILGLVRDKPEAPREATGEERETSAGPAPEVAPPDQPAFVAEAAELAPAPLPAADPRPQPEPRTRAARPGIARHRHGGAVPT